MIEVDTRTGKARAVRATEADGGRDLDSLLAAQQHESERLDSLFGSAKESVSSQSDQLEQQLRRAKEEAKRDKDDKPPSIWDLD